MKTKFLLLTMLTSAFVLAQNQKFKLISFSANLNYPVAFGNNFLSKGYSSDSGYDLTWQINPTRNLFFGLTVGHINKKISNPDLIGDFENGATIAYHNYYIGYRHNLKFKKLYLEHYIGFGTCEITNKSFLSEYIITNGKSFIIGSRINYEFVPEFSLFAGVDFNYTTYPVILSGPYKDFYSKSYQFSPSLGLKFSFWNVGKNKTLNNK